MNEPKRSRPVWTDAERRSHAARVAAQRSGRGGNVQDPVARDPTSKSGGFSNTGSLFVVGLCALFFSYVFNVAGVKDMLDNFFSGMDQSVKSHNAAVADFVTTAIPYAKLAGVAILAWIVLLYVMRLIEAARKNANLSSRRHLTVEEFIATASEHNISAKVAREAYHLLSPHYDHRMRTRMSDSLAGDLQLTRPERADLVGNLLRRTDRLAQWGTQERDIETVLDLLNEAEHATPRFLSHSHRQPNTA